MIESSEQRTVAMENVFKKQTSLILSHISFIDQLVFIFLLTLGAAHRLFSPSTSCSGAAHHARRAGVGLTDLGHQRPYIIETMRSYTLPM